jgi:hypothetical protein
MPIDLTGGLDDEREFVWASQPDDPDLRESVNVWLWDDGVDLGMPRVGVEAQADQWDTHDVQVNLAFADGRVFNVFGPGAVHDPLGADGRPRILGAGPLAFELVEPFRHWRARIDGTATATTVQAQIDGWFPGGPGDAVPIEADLDLVSAVPPWENGTLIEEAGHVLATQEEGDLMGGPRFEQLFRVTGRVRVGDDERELRGRGLRIRRRGIRRLASFWGHAWQSALFPSGRAFGSLVYPPRADGKSTYNEGFVFDPDRGRVPARVVQAPWLNTLRAAGEDVTVVLESELGTTTVHGETILSTFMVMPPSVGGGGINLQQAIVRYTLDGETANGMLERSRSLAALEG